MSHSPFANYERRVRRGQQPRPSEVTLKDFSGGLNVVDTDLLLGVNFAKVLNNFNREVDGSVSLRWGTRYKYGISEVVSGNILDGFYFRDKMIICTKAGEICTIDDAGVITAIWNDYIAEDLIGNPDGWSGGLTLVDSTEFKNELVVCNGVDKPILINKDHEVGYLQDVPTGSNINVPIGKFCTTVNNYVVIAGVAATPDEIYISAAGTSGTWPGDPAPNDAVSINIAAYAPQTGGDLRGLSSFRNYLVVHFASTSLVIVLGEYVDAVHKPRVLDTIPEQGVVSHRTISVIGQELIFADALGVYKAKRNVFGDALENEKLSRLIQPEYISAGSEEEEHRLQSFAIHNKNENRIMYFINNDEGFNIFVMSFDEGLKKRAWSTYSDLEFTGGLTTIRGRIFLFTDTRIYQYGNDIFEGEDYTADRIGRHGSIWDTGVAYTEAEYVLYNGQSYRCAVDHVSGFFETDLADGKWTIFEGADISFEWEFPWSDANSRMRKKRISFIAIDTEGVAAFTFEVFVDRLRTDENGNDTPAISMQFVAADSGGYGNGDQPYGGGRRTADERLWGTPCEFKIFKLRLRGSTKKRLKIVAITVLYVRGTYNR